jgi:adenylate kinase
MLRYVQLNRILLIGMPGAGKGTQAKLLSRDFNLSIIGTGDIIREEWKKRNPLMLPYQEAIEKGGYLPDELIIPLIDERIQNLPEESEGYILDGAIRTIPQAKFGLSNSLIDLILEFQLPENEARKRIIKLRRKTENRKDDSPESVEIRFSIYNKETVPAMDYLKDSCYNEGFPIYRIIDASGSVGAVYEEILTLIEEESELKKTNTFIF